MLIVDDEPYCLLGLQTLLSKVIDVEARCDKAMSGEEAIELVRTCYSNNLGYKIIMMDFSMPGMDGIQATRNILEILRNEFNVPLSGLPKIIGISGHVGEQYEAEALSAGMSRLEPKPLSWNSLRDIISELED